MYPKLSPRRSFGFTLIELMIAVAIIALLAAIAIPQYQNYIIKSQLTRVLAETSSLRTSLEICENDGNIDGACVTDSIRSDMMINSPLVSFSPSEIHATIGGNAHTRLQNGEILLTRDDNSGRWDCELTTPGVSASLHPMACR